MVKVKDQKSAVIYARVSSVGDRQSTDRQVADLQHFARLNGYKVTQVFTEHISGAKKNEERAVLCECLAYCFDNLVDTLLISELSRLGRNVDEVLANVRLCKERKLNIFFQKEGLSTFQQDGTPNPFLNIFIAVLGTCAEMEREAIKFRLDSGLKRYKDAGGKVGRKVGSIKTKEKKQEEYAKVLRCLKQGKSIRDTSVLCGVSVSTVFRVKREFGI